MCALPEKAFEPHHHRRPPQPQPLPVKPIPPYQPKPIIPTGGGIPPITPIPPYKPKPIIPTGGGIPPITPIPPYKPKPIIPTGGGVEPDQNDTNIDPTIVNSFLHNTIKSIYNQDQIKQMPPELQEKAELITDGYEAKQAFDRLMEQEWVQSGYDNDILTDETFKKAARNQMLEEAKMYFDNKYNGRYTLNTEISDENGLVLFDSKSNKALMVYRGASSGTSEPVFDENDNPVMAYDETGKPVLDKEGNHVQETKKTETGKITNDLDFESFIQAMTRVNMGKGSKITTKDMTIQRYPELSSQADKAISEYGVNNLETVVYSNGGVKGHWLRVKKGIEMTAFDPVIGTSQAAEALAMDATAPKAHYVRTTKFSLGMDGLGGSSYVITNPSRNLVDPFSTSHPGLNIEVTNINPVDTKKAILQGKITPEEGKSMDGTFKGGHDSMQFSMPDAPRVKPGIMDGAASTAKSGAVSLLTGLAAGGTTKFLEPKIGHEANLVATAGVNLAYDSAGAAAYAAFTGGSVSTAAYSTGGLMALPTLAAYEAADHVGELMTKVTANWKDRGAALFTTGVTSGSAGASAGVVTYAGVAKSVNAARTLMAGTTETAEGGEMLLGVGESAAGAGDLTVGLLGAEANSAALEGGLAATEVVAEGAAATGGVAATEEAAGAIALIPVPGARVVAGVVAAAGLIGGGLAWIFGDHESKEDKERKTLAKYHELSDKYIAEVKRRKINAGADSYTPLPPEYYHALDKKEIDFMNSMNPNYFKLVDDSVHNMWQTEHDTVQLIDRVNNNRKLDHGGYYTTSKLSQNERRLLQMNAPDYYKQWQDTTKMYREEQHRLHLSNENYMTYRKAFDNHELTNELYTSLITTEAQNAGYVNAQDYIDDQKNRDYKGKYKELQDAKELGLSGDQYVKFYAQYRKDGGFEKAGYMSFQDYLNDFKDGTQNALTQEEDDAADYTEAQNIVDGDGFYTLDEYKYKDNMTEWTPQISQILRAHGMGLTLQQFNNYMEDKSHGIYGMQAFTPKGEKEEVRMDELDFIRQYRPDRTKYTQQDIDDMNSLDYQHLQTDLTASGNTPNAYNADFTENKQAEIRHDNPNLPTDAVFSDEQIKALDAGGSVYNQNDHSVYASA